MSYAVDSYNDVERTERAIPRRGELPPAVVRAALARRRSALPPMPDGSEGLQSEEAGVVVGLQALRQARLPLLVDNRHRVREHQGAATHVVSSYLPDDSQQKGHQREPDSQHD